MGSLHISASLFVIFSYVSQSFLSVTGSCTSYQSDHSHFGTHGVVPVDVEVVVCPIVVVDHGVVGGGFVVVVDTVGVIAVLVVGGSVVVVGLVVLGLEVGVVDVVVGVVGHSSTHIWVSSSNIGLSSGHMG